MLLRLFGRIVGAVALLAAVWVVSALPDSEMQIHVRPVGQPRGPVRILRFYAATGTRTGTIVPGQTAQLCYGVENAKTVRISPQVDQVLPPGNRCLEITPEHTTHYTIVAEGYDGSVVTQPLTLIVQKAPKRPQQWLNMASLRAAVRNRFPAV
jgi:hypothetical protein